MTRITDVVQGSLRFGSSTAKLEDFAWEKVLELLSQDYVREVCLSTHVFFLNN